MNNRQNAERFFNETARIERVIYIGGTDFDALSEDLMSFIESLDTPAAIEKVFGPPSDHIIAALEDDDDFDAEFANWLLRSNRLGFLVQFATPVMTHREHGATFSWGYYNTHWVYADHFDEALEKGFEWVAERRNAEKSAA